MRLVAFLLLVLVSASAAGAQTLTRDPASRNYILRYTDDNGRFHEVVVEATDRVQVDLAVGVSPSSGDTARLAYTYSVFNRHAPGADQSVAVVDIPCPADDPTLTVEARIWNASVESEGDGLAVCEFVFSDEPLGPGARLAGLTVESTRLPGLGEVRVVGVGARVVLPSAVEDTPPEVLDLIDRVQGFDFRTGGGLRATAVVPNRHRAVFTDLGNALRAVRGDLAKICGALGWIANQGICGSLQVKLIQASRSVDRGQRDAARRQIEAFLAELDAQHGPEPGKHVSDNAYWLLKVNVEFVLSRM
jgi:hypothetical protein